MNTLHFTGPTRLRITAPGPGDVEVRTTAAAAWLGIPALALLVLLIPGLFQIAYGLLTLQFAQALAALFFTLAGAAILIPLSFAITHESLVVGIRNVDWTLRLFSWTLRRKSLPIDDIKEAKVLDVGEETTLWVLELLAASGSIRLAGGETDRDNLDLLRQLIESRRKRSA